jgi:choline-sulfatase
VPLLIHVPGLPPRRITERRSIIDIAPTILDLVGAPQPTGEGRDFWSGQSLLPELLGEPAVARPVFIDMSAGPYNDERQALIEDGKKLVVSHGRVLGLYDLDKDPGETQDLSANAELRELMLARYHAFKKRLKLVPLSRK